MRPHLALQASIIAFIEASRVTSASNAAHSPALVSFAAIAQVSSADFRSRSTHKHLRALLREADDGRPPVAHAGSRALARADDDRDLVFAGA